jgi:hypothetical protein
MRTLWSTDLLKTLTRTTYAVKVTKKRSINPWEHYFSKGIEPLGVFGVWQLTPAEEGKQGTGSVSFPLLVCGIMGSTIAANQFFIRVRTALMYSFYCDL